MGARAIAAAFRGFPRTARQLNYQREFLSPCVVKVTIPGGLPYEAFDNTGSKITPWSLLQLFESVRAFIFWPIPHTEKPSGSLVDSHILLQNNFFFIATAKLGIDRTFHDETSPKFPLSVTTELDFVGRSSFRLTSTLQHPDVTPYAVCRVQTVVVDAATRKPCPFPDWWKETYVQHAIGGSSLIMRDLQDVDGAYHCPAVVYSRDTDSYHHTNWASYVRFCADACSIGVMQNKYKNITETSMSHGIRELEISFVRESGLGDTLDVVSWEADDKLNFLVKKDKETCARLSMEYYTDSLHQPKL